MPGPGVCVCARMSNAGGSMRQYTASFQSSSLSIDFDKVGKFQCEWECGRISNGPIMCEFINIELGAVCVRVVCKQARGARVRRP